MMNMASVESLIVLEPAVGPVKAIGKFVASPAGFVVFWIMIVPSFVLFSTHVTFSPAERTIAEIGLPSEQLLEPATHPAGTVSCKRYVFAARFENV